MGSTRTRSKLEGGDAFYSRLDAGSQGGKEPQLDALPDAELADRVLASSNRPHVIACCDTAREGALRDEQLLTTRLQHDGHRVDKECRGPWLHPG